MIQKKREKHNIESIFVLLLFLIFAIAVVTVLALGANNYQSLIERDDATYNRQILTAYLSARIRNNDQAGSLAVGGFQKAEVADDIETLHLYEEGENGIYDTRIYFYNGNICELTTLKDLELEYNAGTPIMEASSLGFEMEEDLIRIQACDLEGNASEVAIALRSESEVGA
ncbi:MAG: DUF4860 domain-containing protein [Eubacterium sp.]|nr:DUF4860 domain-containing protein [Eubacterium sp.]